jgi:hypothetical protein
MIHVVPTNEGTNNDNDPRTLITATFVRGSWGEWNRGLQSVRDGVEGIGGKNTF